MARPSIELVNGLRETANRLRNGSHYSWGHHGSCNCGNLLQVVCELSKEEIVRYAHTGIGEWTELAEEYCESTNVPLGLIMQKLQEIGLNPTDIHNIEYLEDRTVLNSLPGGFRWLRKYERNDVIVYFQTMADLLEEQLLATVVIPSDLINSRKKETELVM
ncbi:MAG: hypothetical protein H7Y31_10730 [Chitinophagaceae bacterium]|nr:hypothetical protein [Chitinophagaceae bacterium]